MNTISKQRFINEMARMKPLINGSGPTIAKLSGIHINTFRLYISGAGGSQLRAQATMYKIIVAARKVYKERVKELKPIK